MNHAIHSARETMAGTLGTDPYEMLEDLRRAGRRKARAEGIAYQMEHERHVVLAEVACSISALRSTEKVSEAKLDRLARSSNRYRQFIEGLGAAVREREEAISEYFAIKSELEWDRAALSHQNALSRLEDGRGG